jgi:transposase
LIYLILDNSSIHPKPIIEKDMKEVPDNVKLVFLPKYAPDLNRVEDINSLVQKKRF